MDDLEKSQSGHPAAMIVLAVALLCTGVVMAASTGISPNEPAESSVLSGTPFKRHLVLAAAGLAVLLVSARLSVGLFSTAAVRGRLGQVLFVVTLGCLVAALMPGLTDVHRGSHRWLRVGSDQYWFSFQPSELAKPALALFLASLLGESAAGPRSFGRGFLPAAAGVGSCVLLVGREDFGTAALLAGVGALVLFVAGCRLTHLLALGSVGAAVMTALLYAEPYRLARLAAYRGYMEDPLGAGYQPMQSLTAIASGGWLGCGLGAGLQKYGYLPESRTDFIFSVICEEAGMLGGALVIGLFCALVYLGLQAMRTAASPFERLLAFGLTAAVGLQAAMNIAVATVVAPTTGISLPLVSAGGSGLLSCCLSIGLLVAVAVRGQRRGLSSEVSSRGPKPTARYGESVTW
jgi:cell division protein FtsW